MRVGQTRRREQSSTKSRLRCERYCESVSEKWLNPLDASKAELKKRTLTNLYNTRPAWLADAHAMLDRAVWAAYGWDDTDPEETSDEEILGRLLALNQQRAAGSKR